MAKNSCISNVSTNLNGTTETAPATPATTTNNSTSSTTYTSALQVPKPSDVETVSLISASPGGSLQIFRCNQGHVHQMVESFTVK